MAIILRVIHPISARKIAEIKSEKGDVVSPEIDIPDLKIGATVTDPAVIKAIQASHPAHVVKVALPDEEAPQAIELPAAPVLKS